MFDFNFAFQYCATRKQLHVLKKHQMWLQTDPTNCLRNWAQGASSALIVVLSQGLRRFEELQGTVLDIKPSGRYDARPSRLLIPCGGVEQRKTHQRRPREITTSNSVRDRWSTTVLNRQLKNAIYLFVRVLQNPWLKDAQQAIRFCEARSSAALFQLNFHSKRLMRATGIWIISSIKEAMRYTMPCSFLRSFNNVLFPWNWTNAKSLK